MSKIDEIDEVDDCPSYLRACVFFTGINIMLCKVYEQDSKSSTSSISCIGSVE
jgi:hypothetical protein